MSTPKLSIITPTLNPGALLADAMESVQAQTWRDWEHLVADGGSTDGTVERVRGLPGVRVHVEADEGIYDAMNHALSLARGEWLYFLGADDRLYDERVLQDVSAYLDPAHGVVYGDVVSDRFDGRYGGEFDAQRLYHHNICHQAVFVHRSVFQRLGAFNTRYCGQADWDHNLRWMLHPRIRARHVDRVIAEYADGGVSSREGDPLFQSEKRNTYLRRGCRTVPVDFGWFLLREEARYCRDHRHPWRLAKCVPAGLVLLARRTFRSEAGDR